MNEACWDDCLESLSATKRSPDPFKAKSLVDTARGRLLYLSKNKPDKEDANYVFEGYYSSLVEFVHAIAILQGYSVSNHLCLGFFLRDVLKRDDLFRIFDDCRIKRNSLIYYGRKMDFETAKETIAKAEKLMTDLEKEAGKLMLRRK